MSKCVAQQFCERILSLELVDPNPGGKVTIKPLPTMPRQEIRVKLSAGLIDYARWAKELEYVAGQRKIELSEMSEKAMKKMCENLEKNVELTLPKKHYTDVPSERIISDYALVQAGFAILSRRLEKLKVEDCGKENPESRKPTSK